MKWNWNSYVLYKRCAQCGRLFCAGDMIFYTNNGYGQFICQKCLERENMSNIKITAEVDGKIVPLNTISTATFEAIKALEKPKEIPVARVGNWPGSPDDRRLFLKISPSIRACIIKYDVKMIAIDLKNGSLGNSWKKAQQIPSFCDGDPYENVKPL